MGQFKPMVKMFTDEPSVILKLKKGGKVASKAASQEEGFKSMAHNNAKVFEDAEHGVAPKKPSMAERRKAMNPNQYAKGGKVAHKQMGGAMPMQGAPAAAMPINPAAPQAMGRQALMAMAPAQRMRRAAMVQKALSGMKKGGSANAKCAALEKELKHHESLSMAKAHPMKKASGGAVDRDETRTTIEGNAKKFAKTKVDDGDHHDSHHGTKGIKDGAVGGYKHGGHAKKMHKFATGGAIPADTDEKVNKGKIKMRGTIEGNEHDYVNTEMHQAKRDKAHGTGGIKESNAGGFKRGGKIHHKAHGGKASGVGNAIEHDGDWENRPADGTPPGKTNGTTGGVRESNGGGYKMGGRASKKAYATGGQVVDDGRAVKMPRHFVSRPVANSLQSGTFAKGGKVEKEEKPNLRLIKTHKGPSGHVAKVYKDRDWDEHRVKFFSPEGQHHPNADYHTETAEDAHDTAMRQVSHGYRKGGKARFAEGGTEDLSKGAYDAHYANEKKENEAMRDSILGAPKRAYDAVKSMFGSSTPPEGSVTKTEKSVTVAPGKKRGGKMC
jgi:hypothetical protein